MTGPAVTDGSRPVTPRMHRARHEAPPALARFRLFTTPRPLLPQNTNVEPVAVALFVIEPVTDDELVGDFKPHVGRRNLHYPAAGLIEQRRDAKRARFTLLENVAQIVERDAGVDDILDQHDVEAADFVVEILLDFHFSRTFRGRLHRC